LRFSKGVQELASSVLRARRYANHPNTFLGEKFRDREATHVELRGGLGNQLFQYFAAAHLAKRVGAPLILHVSRRRCRESNHASYISSFNLDYGNCQKYSVFFELKTLARSVFRRLFLTLGITEAQAESWSKIHIARGIGFDKKLPNAQKGSIILGYFQTFKYFESMSTFGPTKGLTLVNPSGWFHKLSKQAEEAQPIMLHVRRGDYLKQKNQNIGTLASQYFLNALSLVQGQVSPTTTPLWVFSDDIDKVRNELSFPAHYEVRWIDQPAGADAAESMILMGLGSAIIISNSTFSWWAATLCSHQKVVAPSKWFHGQEDPHLLIPSHWLRAESKWVDFEPQ
jgi:hypothetical protein